MERFRAQDTVLKASVLALSGAVITIVSIAIGFALRNEEAPLDNRPVDLAAAVGSTTELASTRTFPKTDVLARAAIVIDGTTGETIFAKNADAPLPLASITKLMTTYVAARRDTLTERHILDTIDLATEGESGLFAGDSLSVRDLVAMALVPSSNDAAVAVARATGFGEVTKFVTYMNDEARRLGMTSSTFRNPSGLDVDAVTAGAVGSARDVSKLVTELASTHRELVRPSTRTSLSVQGSFGIAYRYDNTNPFVGKLPGMILSKTGYTDLAGGNLAVAYDAGINEPIIIVVLGSTQEGRFADVATLASSTAAYLKSGE